MRVLLPRRRRAGFEGGSSRFADSRTVGFHLPDCAFRFEVIGRAVVLTHVQNIKRPRTLGRVFASSTVISWMVAASIVLSR